MPETVSNIPTDRDEELREQILTTKRQSGGDPSLLLDLLCELMERESWKKRGADGWTFLRYVETPFSDGGLGWSRDEVETILQFRHKYEKDGPRQDPEKVEEMEQLRRRVRGLLTPKLNGHGGDRSTENGGQDSYNNLAPDERGSDYLAARIARDHPDVHERMKAGEFRSVRQAAIEAGIIDDIRTKQIRETDSPEKMEAKIRHVYGDDTADRLFGSGEENSGVGDEGTEKAASESIDLPPAEDIDPERAALYLNNLSAVYEEGEHGLSAVPGHVKKILREGLWQRRHCKPTGETVTFDSFREFATAHPPEGLGADLDTLVALCEHDPEALDLLRQHGIG